KNHWERTNEMGLSFDAYFNAVAGTQKIVAISTIPQTGAREPWFYRTIVAGLPRADPARSIPERRPVHAAGPAGIERCRRIADVAVVSHAGLVARIAPPGNTSRATGARRGTNRAARPQPVPGLARRIAVRPRARVLPPLPSLHGNARVRSGGPHRRGA